MESHDIVFDELPGITFTLTRNGATRPLDAELPHTEIDGWLTIEARTESGDVVMSGGMLGPTTLEES